MSEKVRSAQRSIRTHLIVGLVVVLVLAGGFGGWASTVQISGALIAPGQVVVDSNVKKVQHPTGGVVGELRVRDGNRVNAGDIVVALVSGDEATLKRFYREGPGKIRLQPANSEMAPILVAANDVRIQGRVIGVLRKY